MKNAATYITAMQQRHLDIGRRKVASAMIAWHSNIFELTANRKNIFHMY